MRLLKFDEVKPLEWDLKGKTLAQGISGHPAISKEMARFDLTLKDGVLTLQVNGKPVATAKDTEFTEFNRLYLRGNQFQTVDRIVLTPPEK